MVAIYNPSQNFVQISLTGPRCQLQCPHCRARYLKHMAPAITPVQLHSVAAKAATDGAKGMLISGGCDATGQVPVFEYLDIIRNIKENIDISINIHTGFIHLDNIPKLRGKGIDIVSFDIIGSPEVVKRIYGIELEPGYFGKALDTFKQTGLRVVPHITAGLDRGGDSGEKQALEIIARHEIPFVVINALIGENDALAGKRLVEVLKMAREILPRETALGIGCMRPRGDILPPELVKELGIAAVAMPSKNLVRGLQALGIKLEEHGGCCAFYGIRHGDL